MTSRAASRIKDYRSTVLIDELRDCHQYNAVITTLKRGLWLYPRGNVAYALLTQKAVPLSALSSHEILVAL
ncbi:hypothetical protein MY11210_009318 [Beauveria gryllotalpidicola]